jgi:predicted esterase
MPDEIRLVATTIHGRALVRRVDGARPRGVLLGFHGYREDARIQLDRLAAIPGANDWLLVSVQGLHRFYRGRTEDVVASWMTREDREPMIADNIAYVDAVVASLGLEDDVPVVCAGFSQGAAMAFRSGIRGRRRAAAIVGVGGDVPPDVLSDPSIVFPPVLLVRGASDPWHTQDKLEADEAALLARRAHVRSLVVDCAHEWTSELSRRVGPFLASLEHPGYS